MESSKRSAFLFGFVLVLAAVLGGLYGPSLRATAAGTNQFQASIQDFSRVLTIVQKNYADPIDTNTLIFDGAIPGALQELDPHSSFWDPKAYSQLLEQQRGNYYGVGMRVSVRGDHVVIVSPDSNSPALRAGIKPGDIIEKVDGKDCTGLTTAGVAKLLRGPKGTVVTITVGREGWPHPIVVNVERDEIPEPAVEYAGVLRPGIGYVRVNSFRSETTDREFAAALDKIDYSHLEGLILDLRGNGGGLLREAVGMADMFLAKNQLVVSQKGRASPEERYYALRGNEGNQIPVVVLVNGMTASASEIVTGALQDHDRALVAGTLTFGKGLVQTPFPLSDDTMLLLTTARYYIPSGRLIQRNYKNVSIFDYEFDPQRPKTPEVKLTDSGRKVYGGGGITPDVMDPAPQLDDFQKLLYERQVFFPDDPFFTTSDPIGVGDFTRYFMGTRPAITSGFTVDNAVMKSFTGFLDREHIDYTAAEIRDNLDWIKGHIKREVFTYALGLPEGFKISAENDLQVQKAIDLIPQARALYANALKILALRESGQPPS